MTGYPYGLHGSIRAVPGKRDALLELLLETARTTPSMPGCRLYLVSTVPGDPDAVAVTEVWDDKAAHDTSLALDRVRSVIARARPFIAGIGASSEFRPVGGLTPDGLLVSPDRSG